MKSFKVPFINGCQRHYADDWQNPTWQDPYEFEDELKVISHEKGRSRVTIKLQSVINSRTYECTLDKFFDMLSQGIVRQLGSDKKYITIAGTFGFKKLGSTVSLYLVRATT